MNAARRYRAAVYDHMAGRDVDTSDASRNAATTFVHGLLNTQEAQLSHSQRDRAMFGVIEYFAKSLRIIQGH